LIKLLAHSIYLDINAVAARGYAHANFVRLVTPLQTYALDPCSVLLSIDAYGAGFARVRWESELRFDHPHHAVIDKIAGSTPMQIDADDFR
jgi:hypothetical protein